ncbi:MAG: hypothetical protein GY747_04545 [Planctomycetes bacterium]|nr:hypothetical protein [Planctomycetota bacterium]MCP4771474.1 hypothetical protein [Planctomycetota bacterium]MCP4861135.1 hypothetical protein [Planctomycetota bacterium]
MRQAALLMLLLFFAAGCAAPGQEQRAKTAIETFEWNLDFSERELTGMELEAGRLPAGSDRVQLLDQIANAQESIKESREVLTLLEENNGVISDKDRAATLDEESDRLEVIRRSTSTICRELIKAQPR